MGASCSDRCSGATRESKERSKKWNEGFHEISKTVQLQIYPASGAISLIVLGRLGEVKLLSHGVARKYSTATHASPLEPVTFSDENELISLITSNLR